MSIKRAEFIRLLDQLSLLLGKEFLVAISKMTSSAQIARMVKAIELGSVTKVMQAAGMRVGSWSTLTEQIRNAYVKGGAFTIANEVPAKFGMVFDISNPRATMWLRNRSSKFITQINKEQRKAIQLILKDGMKLGRNPRTIGLDIVGRIGKGGVRVGGIIGLNTPQTFAVMKAGHELRSLDPNYFTRVRRDRRFDRVVRKAMESGKALPSATVNRLTGRYSDRLKELRGATIGRTEALASLNAAADESMQQVIDEGLAPKKAIKRIWHHGGYSKDERVGHKAMGRESQTRDMDKPFVNPYTKVPMMYPGDGPGSEVINCRCWVEHKVDFVAVEKAGEPPPLPGLKPRAVIKKAKLTQFGGLIPKRAPGQAQRGGSTWNIPNDAKHINSVDGAASWVLKKSKGTFDEYGVIFTKNGRLYDARGGDASVHMKDALKHQKNMKDGTFIHNHPNGEPLSPPDIGTASLLELRTVAAVGNRYENYYVATDFRPGIKLTVKETAERTALRISDKRQSFLEKLDVISYRNKAPVVGKRYVNRALIKKRYNKDLISHEEYRRQLAAERVYQGNLDIAIAIINNQLAAKYGGYAFKYTLEAGAHSQAVKKIIKELADAGFIEFLEKHALTQIESLKVAWLPLI